MNPRNAVCFLAVLIASVPLALAQGTYTQIDVPGASQTIASGINSFGDIVGSYLDTGGYRGFLLSVGTYTAIDAPDASDTYAVGINDVGQLVGRYSTGSGVSGYLYDIQSQTLTKIVVAGAKNQTEPTAINNVGTIVGDVFLRQGNQYFPVGFQLTDGTYFKVVPHGFNSSYVNGISNSGLVVGCAFTQASCTAFLFNQGGFQRVQIPNNYIPYGTNTSGAIVGVYSNQRTEFGFLFQNGTLQKIVFPGSILTDAFGINDAGEVVGEFFDSAGVAHGFLWTPPASEHRGQP